MRIGRNYFLIKKNAFESQSSILKAFISRKNNLTAASFHVANCIARHGKPLSEGEFVKSLLLELSYDLFEDFKDRDMIINRFRELPISRNTVKDRIVELDMDISKQIRKDLNNSEVFSIALDESVDVNGFAQFAVFARYISNDIIHEELIKLITLKGSCSGLEMFKVFFEELQVMNIDLQKIVSVTTDGAPSMVGKNVGFVQILKQNLTHPIIDLHCIIHQQVSCSKYALKTFSKVINVVIKTVNFINARSLNKRKFSQLLEEAENRYLGVLTFNNVRWLSCGQVLERFVFLFEEIKIFMHEKNNSYDEFSNVDWLNDLMFLSDITYHLNQLNKNIQGKGKIVLMLFEDIKIFIQKLDMFIKDLEFKSLKYFPHLKKHFENSSSYKSIDVSQGNALKYYMVILKDIKYEFEKRFDQFKTLEKTFKFLLYPLKVNFKEMDLSQLSWLGIENLEMELIELQNSILWKEKFENLVEKVEVIISGNETEIKDSKLRVENIILNTWKALPIKFKSTKKLAYSLLTMFGSTYSCEKLFSSMNYIKSSNRNKLGNEMTEKCVKLMNTEYKPDIESLSANKQQQTSH